jgi:hypothetical protein
MCSGADAARRFACWLVGWVACGLVGVSVGWLVGVLGCPFVFLFTRVCGHAAWERRVRLRCTRLFCLRFVSVSPGFAWFPLFAVGLGRLGSVVSFPFGSVGWAPLCLWLVAFWCCRGFGLVRFWLFLGGLFLGCFRCVFVGFWWFWLFFWFFRSLCFGLVLLVGAGPSFGWLLFPGLLGFALSLGFVSVSLAVFAWVRFFFGGLVSHSSNGGLIASFYAPFVLGSCLRGL